MAGVEPFAGVVAYVDFGSNPGREQSGIRPGVVLNSSDFTSVVHELAIVVPCTKRDRGWPNHVKLQGPTGLDLPTFGMTEQIRAVDVGRILRTVGTVNNECLQLLGRWTRTWIHLPA